MLLFSTLLPPSPKELRIAHHFFHRHSRAGGNPGEGVTSHSEAAVKRLKATPLSRSDAPFWIPACAGMTMEKMVGNPQP
jgi:hypothetical protein